MLTATTRNYCTLFVSRARSVPPSRRHLSYAEVHSPVLPMKGLFKLMLQQRVLYKVCRVGRAGSWFLYKAEGTFYDNVSQSQWFPFSHSESYELQAL